jgi:uncharacterized protein (TIGR03790 family)
MNHHGWVIALLLATAGLADPDAACAAATHGGEAAGHEAPASSAPAAGAAATAAAPPRRWISVPRIQGRLTGRDIGLVVNIADPYSVAIGAHYRKARNLAPEQVLEVSLPVEPEIGVDAFEALRRRIDERFGPQTQALALAWVQPFAVQCNSLTGALAMGFDAALCSQPCARSRPSRYLNSASVKPLADHGLRLSMLLAAPLVEQAQQMIDRGVAADGRLGLRGAPPVHALFVSTPDHARNVRERLFPPAGTYSRNGVQVETIDIADLPGRSGVVLVNTGAVRVPRLDSLRWADGALADHLTSVGGRLDGSGGQMSALEWIASGATASYGTVSEPCNHPQKFPHPQLLLLHYAQGSTAIEAYWRSVAWPQQGVFVGEPLAAPFARR